MKISTTFRKILKHPGTKLWAVLIWLLLWQIGYQLLSGDKRDLLLSSPFEVLKHLGELVKTREYWQRILFSTLHVMAGMLCGALAGTLLGMCAFFVSFVKELLRPLVSAIRSVPVVSFIVIAVYWLDYADIGLFIAFLICFPVFYSNTLSGLGTADRRLHEMAQVFRLGFFKRLSAIYLPALTSHLHAAGEVAVGLAWKSGVAAEYIATVTNVISVGGGLFNAKKDWSTVDVLAWTVTIVALSAVCGFAVKTLLGLAGRKWGSAK